MPEKDHNLTQRELLLLDIMGKRFGEGDEEDFNASITSPQTDEGLFYDGNKWVNLPIVGGSSISVSGRTISVNSTKESEWDTAFTHSQITTGNPHSLDTGDVPEAGNLYYTNERVDDRVSNLIQNGTGISWSYDDPNNTLTGNVSLSPFSTSDLSEGTNLYYTNARVEAHIAPDGDFQNLGTGDNVQFVDGSFSGNVTITGNLSVSGTTFTVDAQTVEVEDNVIVLNKGETGAGVTNGESGIRVDRGTSIDFLFVFDEVRDRFVVGKASDETDPSIAALQAVATRQDSPASGGIPFWNNTENRFDNSANATLDSSGNLTAVAGTFTGNVGVGNSLSKSFTNEGAASYKVRVGDESDSGDHAGSVQTVGRHGSTTSGVVGRFEFLSERNDDVYASIEAWRDGGIGDGSIRIKTAAAGVLSNAIIIDSAGLLTAEAGIAINNTGLSGYTALYANGTAGINGDLDLINNNLLNASIAASLIDSGTFADARISQSSVTQHEAAINHDALANFVANEHIDHSAVSISAGTGLSGGGTITASRTLSLNANVNNLNDVFNSTPADKHVLIYDGVTDNRYENRALVEADISDFGNYSEDGHSHPASDITSGTFADARISQSSVTQHEAALTITESQITNGSILARLAANETVTGAWTFEDKLQITQSGQSRTGNASEAVQISSAGNPRFVLDETDATANNAMWDLVAVGGQLRLRALSDDVLSTGNIMTADRTGTTINKVSFSNNIVEIDPQGGQIDFRYGGTEDTRILMNVIDDGGVVLSALRWSAAGNWIEFTDSRFAIPDHGTTPSSANTFISSTTGLIERSTSSLRYKTDVRPFSDIYALDRPYNSALDIVSSLNPILFKSIQKNYGDKDFIGLIAEDVHEVIPELCTYINLGTPEEPDIQPDWVEYPKLTAVLIAAIKEQQIEIENLKSQLI